MASKSGNLLRPDRTFGPPAAGVDRMRNGAVILVLGCVAIALGVLYWPGLAAAGASWARDEYSYGYIVPFVASYLLLRKLPEAAGLIPDHRWVGPLAVALAVTLGIAGRLSRIPDLSGYGFVLAIAAVSITCLGLTATKRLWQPIVYLMFMLPLPQIVYLKLSSSMQLASSELGVALLRLLGVPVLLEGNVIDLGIYQLQVAEACSGLRYLFPLMSFGFLFAILYRGPAWQKWTLFLSTVPITIAMNSFRIGVIGLLVPHYGTEIAEGFLHIFQGWVIFLGCIFLLFAEACLLLRCARHRRTLRDALAPEFRAARHVRKAYLPPLRPVALAFTAGLFGIGVLADNMSGIGDASAIPARQPLVNFASAFDGWQSTRFALPDDVVRVLAADDYLYADYARKDGSDAPVNLFIAYYRDQRDGRAVHSPEVCLIGGGWEIREFGSFQPATAAGKAGPRVNRAIIQKGLSRMLVYYWFEERGRIVTNGYLAKWYILWDGITRDRTDGGLVRLLTPVSAPGDEQAADARLREFLFAIRPMLPTFLPR